MFLKNFFKEKRVIFFSAIFTFLFLESLVFLAVSYAKKSEVSNYLDVVNPDFKTHIDMANSYLTDISKIFYDTKINQPEIVEIMAEASHTQNPKERAKLRAELLKRLSPTYLEMKNYHVRQFHFHLPNAISFLRFHRPELFGDSLAKVRETIVYEDKNKTFISAFEEGRIFNGFRNVYPIFKGDEFVGTVEISFSFEGIEDFLSKINSTTYLFMIENKIVSEKVFKNDKKKNYIKSQFLGFDYDKKTLNDSMQIGLKEAYIINKDISKEVQQRLKEGKLFSINFKNKKIYDNHSIIISFSPVVNLDDKVVAYIIHYKFGDFIDIILKNLKILFFVLTLLAFILSAILTSILLRERKKQELMHELAVKDALTGIYNRHGVNDLLNQKLAEFSRDKIAFSVIFFDIDLFKRVNGNYGHDIGDYVLENIAKIVSKEIRESDIFARWGGEEFILFLSNTTIEEALNVAEKLRRAIETHAFSDIDSITCSFGVTTLREEDSKTAFLKRVDTLLYKAKESGHNCVVGDV